jgi:hypothetical protein
MRLDEIDLGQSLCHVPDIIQTVQVHRSETAMLLFDTFTLLETTPKAVPAIRIV